MRKPQTPHWIRHSHLFSSDTYECSACGAVFRRKSPRCPKCGAVLRAVRDDQGWVDEAAEAEWMLDD